MKKLLTFALTTLLGAGLVLAQDTGGDKATDSGKKAASGKKATKTKKKGKKSGGTTTQPPK